MGEFSKYRQMRESGATAAVVYTAAKHQGMDTVMRYRLLREVFDLDLAQAKEVMIVADGGASLEAHQENLIEPLRQLLEENEEQS